MIKKVVVLTGIALSLVKSVALSEVILTCPERVWCTSGDVQSCQFPDRAHFELSPKSGRAVTRDWVWDRIPVASITISNASAQHLECAYLSGYAGSNIIWVSKQEAKPYFIGRQEWIGRSAPIEMQIPENFKDPTDASCPRKNTEEDQQGHDKHCRAVIEGY